MALALVFLAGYLPANLAAKLALGAKGSAADSTGSYIGLAELAVLPFAGIGVKDTGIASQMSVGAQVQAVVGHAADGTHGRFKGGVR
jgi:hypothetical protein